MNVSYEWLRALVPTDRSANELRDLITSRVATVDEVVPLRADLAPIVVARVVEEVAHPDSDHLHVTKVDAGTGELIDVVCGAPNVTAGKLYPFAPVGTTMPNGMKIEKRKIRGATSAGMLCSARELGLGQEHDGILELDLDVPTGTPFLRVVPVGDAQIVIDVGANRPDLLSHYGVAREVAAATGLPIALPTFPDAPSVHIPEPKRYRKAGNAGGVVLHVQDDRLVRRFMGVVIRGVKVGPSPEWLVRRLEAVGSRSINNVVDASNYVLHELGQPTHAFDLAKFDAETKLPQRTLVVREAHAGEKIVTLDGVERTLPEGAVVIADSERAQAIAGIMGGQETEVTDATTDVLLEVANFDPARIRAARRKLGMATDGSYRFERGVDVELGPIALNRVASLIIAVAGGSVDAAPADIVVNVPGTREIEVRVARVARVLGEVVPDVEIAALLSGIGFGCTPSTDVVRVTVPSWRADVTAEVDVIEEVARLRGYDSFSTELRPFRPTNVPDAPHWTTAARLRDVLAGAGLLEVRPMPFVAGASEGYIRVVNPIAENEAYLRRSLLETLAGRAEHNLAHMQGDVRLFEIGAAFAPSGNTLPNEEMRVAALVMGRRFPAHFTDPKSEEFTEWAQFGAWDARALAEVMAKAAYPGAAVEFTAAADALWSVAVDGHMVGHVKRMHLDAPVWAAPAFGIEISMGVVESADVAPAGEHAHREPSRPRARPSQYRALPTTPAAEFDLALLVPPGVNAADVEHAIRGTAGELLESLALFDEYRGSGLADGARSVAWRLTFRHPERTLRDKEIEGRRAKILSVLEKELNVRPRTS